LDTKNRKTKFYEIRSKFNEEKKKINYRQPEPGCGDFEELTDYIDKDTFVYIDPPYRPLNVTSSFNSYQKDDFNDESQERLARWFAKIDKEKNALVMLSNSNPKNINPEDDFFERICAGYNIQKVYASRQINSKSAGRGEISELLIRNYTE